MKIVVNKRLIETYFKRQAGVDAVFLFGSVAKQRARRTSDVDLAVLWDASLAEENYLDTRLRIMADLSDQLGRDVDIILLNEAGPVLTHQVLSHGIVLYEKNRQVTTSFKAKAMLDYIDWQPYQARLDQAVLKHFRHS